MKSRCAVLALIAGVVVAPRLLADPAATIGTVTYKVNGVEGLEFVGEGDLLYLSGGATCTIGGGDADTQFYQTTYLIPQFAENPVAVTYDSAFVTSGAPDFGTDTTFDDVGYAVPMGGEETYEAWIVIEYLNGMAMLVTADTEMQYFIAD